MTRDNAPIVKMLLENLTASLTQMVVKYESISKDCDKIEERAAEIITELRDVREIKDIVGKIRSQCEQNLQITQNILDVLTQSRHDVDELLARTAESHAVQAEKLSAIAARLETVSSDISKGFAGVETKIDDTRSKIIPVAKAARIVSTPMGIVLFIIGFLAAAFFMAEILSSTWKVFDRNSSQAGAVQTAVPAAATGTNRVSAPNRGN